MKIVQKRKRTLESKFTEKFPEIDAEMRGVQFMLLLQFRAHFCENFT